MVINFFPSYNTWICPRLLIREMPAMVLNSSLGLQTLPGKGKKKTRPTQKKTGKNEARLDGRCVKMMINCIGHGGDGVGEISTGL